MSTLQAFITFAAEVGEEEKSQTLFYIVGGLAALYAVILSVIGITQHDFPKTQGAARGVFALSTLIVVAVMATVVATS